MCIKISLMRLRRANITSILLFCIVAICLYLIQRIALFEVGNATQVYLNFRELNYPEYIITFICLIGFSVWLFFVEKKKGDLRIHYPLIILLTALFVISVIAIVTFPSELKVDVPVYNEIIHTNDNIDVVVDYYKHAYIYISLEQRIMYILISFTALYLVYIFIWVLPRKIRYIKELDIAMYIIIIFAIVAMIYSFAVDREKYLSFFIALRDPEQYFPYGISSFLGNRNSFGIAMTFACFACLYLHHTSKKWWFIPLSFIFVIESVLISSKTNVLVCAIVELVYLIAIFVFQFKKRLKFSIIIVSVIGFLLLTFAGLVVIHAINNNFLATGFSYLEKLYDYFIGNVLQNANSFTGRNRQHEKVLQLLNMGYWGIGLGYGLFNYVFQGMENIGNVPNMFVWDKTTIYTYHSDTSVLTDTPHSSYFQMLGTGGIPTLVVYGLLICYLIFAMVRVFKKHKLTVIMCAAFLVGALLHGLTEAPTLIFPGPVYVDSLLFTSFIILPILSLYYHDKHPSERKKFLADYEQKDTKMENYKEPFLVSKSIYFFLTPVVILVCGVCPIFWNPFLPENRILLIGMIVSLALFVIAPLVTYFIFGRKEKITKFLLDVVAPYFATAIVFIGFAWLYRLAFGRYSMTLSLLMGLFLFVSYIALFSTSKYMFAKAGIITWLMDSFCNVVYKHQSKYIEVSDDKDSLTLDERIFGPLITKRVEKYETRDN